MTGLVRRTPRLAAAVAAGALMLPLQVSAQDAQAPQPTTQEQSQPSQPQAAQPQPAQQQNPFSFGSDAALMTFLIKPDKAADFEKVMAKLHEALANSDKPERRQQAESWKLYKAAEPGPNGAVVYYNLLTPVLKGADYTPSKIIAEVFPSEALALFQLYRDAFAGLARSEMTLLRDFSTPTPRTPPVTDPASESTSDGAASQPQP
ncbi:MAG TPA: hypothetical protein VF198_13905 [Vicinamibacterales bacterium]